MSLCTYVSAYMREVSAEGNDDLGSREDVYICICIFYFIGYHKP